MYNYLKLSLLPLLIVNTVVPTHKGLQLQGKSMTILLWSLLGKRMSHGIMSRDEACLVLLHNILLSLIMEK